MSDFVELLDLVSERVGGSAIAANDEFFAPKECLVKTAPAVFKPDEYTDRGKWMDGWETRRRREPGHDWCLLRLGVPGRLRGVIVDTAHFRGNHPESCSLEGTCVDGAPDLAAIEAAEWIELLPKTTLAGDTANRFVVNAPWRLTHLRLRIHPDGGVARLRVHGEPMPLPAELGPGLVDLAAAVLGGRCVSCSDSFFGPRHNLIMPGDSRRMDEGWETRRRRGPGHDWVAVRLAATGLVREVVVDTTHFKGNAPDRCSLEGIRLDPGAETVPESGMAPLLAETKLRPHTRHRFVAELIAHEPVSMVRLRVYPDGGIARLRLLGEIDAEERRRLGVRALDALLPGAAERALLECCGARAWARAMAAARPFGTAEELLSVADDQWMVMGPDDVKEAFAAHPRIGERAAGSSQHARWSAQEQAAAGATGAVSEALAEANRAYEARFGHTFIVCATGRSADEMLAACRERMNNDPSAELGVAAEEQRKITRLRLEKRIA